MKQSYHPALITAYYLECLPEKIKHQIPDTTLHYWKHKNNSTLFGHHWFLQNKHLFTKLQHTTKNNKLQKLSLAFIRVIALKKFIQKYLHKKEENHSAVINTIVTNMYKISAVLGTNKMLSCLDLSYGTYLNWKNKKRCSQSLLSLCRVKHPKQLTYKEVQTIQQYCLNEKFQYWPLSAIYYQMIRDKAAICRLPTFYKYASLLNIKRKRCKKLKPIIGIRASKCFEILHADITIIKTADNVKTYLYLIQDNFSRAILTYAYSQEKKAIYTLQNLQYVYNTYLNPQSIKNTILLTDGGSENYGEVKNFITVQTSIQHLVAQTDIHFSNSMIEAANKKLKYNYLYHQHISSYDLLPNHIKTAIDDFNNRPNAAMQGLTPNEVINGETKIILTPLEIEKAKNKRIIENKKKNVVIVFKNQITRYSYSLLLHLYR